ncbi:hypothetical protein ACIQVA_00490 [Streptomyces microflavus]|uniref:hypothetical protein n=1 Tax=Streptomyces microflavus TaxID=1919 RepID=UPI003821942D
MELPGFGGGEEAVLAGAGEGFEDEAGADFGAFADVLAACGLGLGDGVLEEGAVGGGAVEVSVAVVGELVVVQPVSTIFLMAETARVSSLVWTSTRYRAPVVEVTRMVLKLRVAMATGVKPRSRPMRVLTRLPLPGVMAV